VTCDKKNGVGRFMMKEFLLEGLDPLEGIASLVF